MAPPNAELGMEKTAPWSFEVPRPTALMWLNAAERIKILGEDMATSNTLDGLSDVNSESTKDESTKEDYTLPVQPLPPPPQSKYQTGALHQTRYMDTPYHVGASKDPWSANGAFGHYSREPHPGWAAHAQAAAAYHWQQNRAHHDYAQYQSSMWRTHFQHQHHNSYRAPPGLATQMPRQAAPRAPAAQSATGREHYSHQQQQEPTPTPAEKQACAQAMREACRAHLDAAPPGPVTLVVRNMPSRCTSEHLLEAMELAGYKGRFDFLYLPMKPPRVAQNRGYAFVGFVSAAEAREFFVVMQGCRFNRISNKEMSMEVAQQHRSMQEVIMETKTMVMNTRFGAVLVHANSSAEAKGHSPRAMHTTLCL